MESVSSSSDSFPQPSEPCIFKMTRDPVHSGLGAPAADTANANIEFQSGTPFERDPRLEELESLSLRDNIFSATLR